MTIADYRKGLKKTVLHVPAVVVPPAQEETYELQRRRLVAQWEQEERTRVAPEGYPQFLNDWTEFPTVKNTIPQEIR